MDHAQILLTKKDNTLLVIAEADKKPCYLVRKKERSGGAVCVGRVENAIKNLQAAFVRYDDKEIGYLPFSDVPAGALLNRPFLKDDVLKAGDLLCVQVLREAHGTKQARLSAYPALHGRYAVLGFEKCGVGCAKALPSDVRSTLVRAFKKKLEEETDATAGKALPDGDGNALPHDFSAHFGVILRTECGALFARYLAEGTDREEAASRTAEDALQDVRELFLQMKRIMSQANARPAGSVLYRPDETGEVAEILLRAFHFLERAYGDCQVDVVCSSEELFEKADASAIRDRENVTVRQNGEADAVYGVKGILEDLAHRVVWLKSGAYLVIEETEAMTVVDVNSGKYIAKKDDDFLKVNLEAADEVMRQIRLRDLSGIIVVDFINMREGASNTQLKERLKALAAPDPVFTRFHDITALGLAEITRTAH